MPIAYSYKRFSSEKQAKGDSLRRQTELAERYIAQHPELNLILDTDRDMTDSGMSAYKGTHLSKGALGVFVRAVEDGLIERGSYLLVESLDRLSRKQPADALPQLIDLVRSGIVVVTLGDNKTYSEATLQGVNGTFVLMQSLVGMARAFEESETKGRRVAAAWQNKFNQIKNGVQLTKRVPFWIDGADLSVKPDRAAIVLRIFEEYESGRGTTLITKGLNRDQVSPPTAQASYWNDSTVKKTLKNKAVIGVLTTGDGQEHPGYYPIVMPEELWHACQLQGGVKTARSRKETPRPLAGLLRCSCRRAGTIIRVTRTGRLKKDGTRNSYESVACSVARQGVEGCLYRSLPYQKVIKAINDHIPMVQQLAEVTDNEEALRNIDGYMGELADQVRDAYELFKSNRNSVVARDAFAALDREYRELERQRAALVAAVGSVGRTVLESLLQKPVMTNQWLRKVFKGGVLDLVAERLVMTLHSGQTIEIPLNAEDDGLGEAL